MKYGTLLRLSSVCEAPEKLAALREFGMDACQLIYKPEKYDTADALAIKKAAEDAGIEISAQFCGYRDSNCIWDTRFDFLNSGINSPFYGGERVNYLLSAIPFMKALGVTDMVIHPGFIPNDPFADAYSRMLAASSSPRPKARFNEAVCGSALTPPSRVAKPCGQEMLSARRYTTPFSAVTRQKPSFVFTVTPPQRTKSLTAFIASPSG